jgi:hypothetical protein
VFWLAGSNLPDNIYISKKMEIPLEITLHSLLEAYYLILIPSQCSPWSYTQTTILPYDALCPAIYLQRDILDAYVVSGNLLLLLSISGIFMRQAAALCVLGGRGSTRGLQSSGVELHVLELVRARLGCPSRKLAHRCTFQCLVQA